MTFPPFKKSLRVLLLVIWAAGAAGCGQPAGNLPLPVASLPVPTGTIPGEPGRPSGLVDSSPAPIGVSLSTPTLEARQQPIPPDGAPTALAPCDLAAPGIPIDVTIPDDTQLEPGETFTKVWRLFNSGGCVWTQEYSFQLFSGDVMGAPQQVYLTQEVLPGSSVDLEVDLVAPQQAGKYQGNWKLRNANQEWFGIGPGGSAPFWVRVVVAPAATEDAGILAEAELPAPSPTAMIAARGAVSLALDSGLDLDYFPQAEPDGEDLMYRLDGQGQPALAPVGSAQIWLYGASAPEMDDCLANGPAGEEVPLSQAPPGAYLCYRTNLGLPGWLQVLSASSPEPIATETAMVAPTETPAGEDPGTPPGGTPEPGEGETQATPSTTENPAAIETPAVSDSSLDLEIFTWSIP